MIYRIKIIALVQVSRIPLVRHDCIDVIACGDGRLVDIDKILILRVDGGRQVKSRACVRLQRFRKRPDFIRIGRDFREIGKQLRLQVSQCIFRILNGEIELIEIVDQFRILAHQFLRMVQFIQHSAGDCIF